MRDFDVLGLVFTPADDASHEDLSRVFEPRMPSWVPDWRPRVSIARLVDSAKAVEGGLPLYNPLPGTKIEARVCINEPELKGHVANDLYIEMLTSIWDDAEGSLLISQAWYNTMMATRRPTGIFDRAIRRSLVGDRSRAVCVTKDNDFSRIWKRSGIVNWALLDLGRDELDWSSVDHQEDVSNDMMNVCYRRRMALLTGRRVAILPAAAKTGDQVAAFHGGNCLYLVRPLSNLQAAYTFIGECYVDGLMDGAFLDMCRKSGKVAELLKLV